MYVTCMAKLIDTFTTSLQDIVCVHRKCMCRICIVSSPFIMTGGEGCNNTATKNRNFCKVQNSSFTLFFEILF